ncbi:MAG: hypothetical protein D6696_20800, partial [Acidobacteria bacterium]
MGRPGFLLALAFALPAALLGRIPDDAVALKNRGLAELENEKPEEAEATFRRLVEILPDDPLPWADLAIALLRQQKYAGALAAIERGLEQAPGRADLLAIKGEILQWSGDLEAAVDALEAAATAAPDDVEVLYALLNQATLAGDDAAARRALEGLARLRPENLVVLLQLARQAIDGGDRATASRALLRIDELLWQAPPIAERAMAAARDALEGEDVRQARVPVMRLENVLKVTPMFRESLRELRTGIQGIPLERFAAEPPPSRFGDALPVTFRGEVLDPRPSRGRALAAGDLDGDEKPDLVRVRAGDEGAGDVLEVRLARDGWRLAAELPAAGVDGLLATDLTNDGHLDVIGFGAGAEAVWLGAGDGTLSRAPEDLGLAGGGTAAAAIDFDIEGDLDLALAGAGGVELYRNNLAGPLEAVGARALPAATPKRAAAAVASDLDRDGDLDLLLAHGGGLSWLDNLRQGQFADRTAAGGLAGVPAATAVISADLDNDGRPDLVAAAGGLRAWHNRGGRFEPWTLLGLRDAGAAAAVIAFDADNDGRLDLATAGEDGVRVLGQGGAGRFLLRRVSGAPARASAIVARDLDLDGDLDLVVAGAGGLHRLLGTGGEANGWLALRLRGLTKGNSKNNVLGIGAAVEVKNGRAYQFREADADVVHLGLGDQRAAEVLRVTWTNGVPQNRFQVAGRQRLVEEQVLKGSCPFLYAWDGERFAFVTDLLWGAPIGLPVGPGQWAASDPDELVRIDGLAVRDGRYELRITEELWEAAFFDHLRLWVVDHPAAVEVASNLRIVPGVAPPVDRVLASRDLRPLAAAIDGRGRDVTGAVARRDEVYAAGYVKSPYQGLAAAPWSFVLDLGTAPEGPLRLHLDGWIFPTDASINLAVAQRDDLAPLAPRLEVETAGGWRLLTADMGFPAGKTKTMVVEVPPLPRGARRLRIVTNLWLHWDRIAWSTAPADGDAAVVARLLPTAAELRRRGFSALLRRAPNAPHVFDYETVSRSSPWLPFPGRYTRYGDVRPLLAAADDLSVILAPG